VAHATLAESTLGDAMTSGKFWTPASKLLSVPPGASAGDALALLAAGRVLSAPLLGPQGDVAGVAEERAYAAAFLRSYGAHRSMAAATSAALCALLAMREMGFEAGKAVPADASSHRLVPSSDIQAGEAAAAAAGADDAGSLAGAAAGALAAEAARRAAEDVAKRPASEALIPCGELPCTLRLSGYAAQTPLLEVVRRALLRQRPPATEQAAHDETQANAATEAPRHRVLLTAAAGPRDEVLGLLSSSDVARFLEARLPAEALAAQLTDLRLPPSRAPPHRASLAEPALHALRTLIEGNVAALLATDDATDDEDAPLVACFSHSDLRALGPHDFGLLALPLGACISCAMPPLRPSFDASGPRLICLAVARVGEFLVLQRALAQAPRAAGLSPALAASSASAAAGLPRAPPLGRCPGWREALPQAAPLVALPRSVTLAQLLAAMRLNRVHRVFISPESDASSTAAALPDAVVSVTDVLRALADGPPPQ
jgi:CBS domain-containing protein